MGYRSSSEDDTLFELVLGEGSDFLRAVEDGDLPVAFLDADVFPGDAPAAKNAVGAEGDVAAVGDPAGGGVGRVGDLGQRVGPGTRAGHPAGDRRLVAQRLVRPPGVVQVPPGVAVAFEVATWSLRALNRNSSRSDEACSASTLPWVWGW